MKTSILFVAMLGFGLLSSGCEDGILTEGFSKPENTADAYAEHTYARPGDPRLEKGQVVFWSKDLPKGEELEITVINEALGIKEAATISAAWILRGGPDCESDAGSAQFTLPSGEYFYLVNGVSVNDATARPAGFVVYPGQCTQMQITKDNVLPSTSQHEKARG